MRDKLREVKEIFDKLAKLKGISSTNSKKTFIKANKDDKLFLDTLEFLLNPYKVTNISKKKIEKKVTPIHKLNTLNELYDFLCNTCTGKDSDIAIVLGFIEDNKEFEDYIKALITKSYKLGVAAKLVNSALEYTLIPDFGVQLASKFEEKNLKGKDFVVSNKVDGIKCICIIDKKGDIKFYTRQGKEILQLNDIENSLKKLELNDIVLDGELYYNGEVEDSKEGYKKTMNNVSVKGIKNNLKYIVYDTAGSTEQFYNGYCDVPTSERKRIVNDILKDSDEFVEYLGELYVGNDSNVIPDLLKQADDNGEEGIIVSIADAPWESKRSKGCMKLKSFNEAEVYVTSVFEGDNKYKGKMGGVNAKFIYNEKVCDVKIGSGWSDKDREYLFDNPEEIEGKVITISFFEITKNSSTNNYSLRFPTVTLPFPECIRTDKTTLEDTHID